MAKLSELFIFPTSFSGSTVFSIPSLTLIACMVSVQSPVIGRPFCLQQQAQWNCNLVTTRPTRSTMCWECYQAWIVGLNAAVTDGCMCCILSNPQCTASLHTHPMTAAKQKCCRHTINSVRNVLALKLHFGISRQKQSGVFVVSAASGFWRSAR